MSYVPRQKRQARSYWAELGFLALGLFALQPNLLTGLFSGSQTSASNYAERLQYPASQALLYPNSQSWSANSMAATYPIGFQSPNNMTSYSPMAHSAPPYSTTPYSTTPYNSAQQSWGTQSFTGSIASHNPSWNYQQPPNVASAWDTQQGHYPTAQTGNSYQQPYQFAQASSNTWDSGWPMSSSTGLSGQWPNTSQSNRGGSGNSSNLFAGSTSNPFNSLITKPSQSPLFGNGSSNYGTGTYGAANYSPSSYNPGNYAVGNNNAVNYGADNYLSRRLNATPNYQGPTNARGSGFVPYQPQSPNNGNSIYR